MKRKCFAHVAGGLVTLAFSITANAAVIPISSSLNLIGVANATTSSTGTGVTASATHSQGATTNALVVSVSVGDSPATSGASVDVSGAITATFLGASEGTLTFTRLGWRAVDINDGLATLNSGNDWDYTFTATQDGQFNLDWDISSTGTNPFGLNGFQLLGIGSDQLILLGTPTGTLSRSIVAGTTYTFSLDNGANIAGGLGTREAYISGTFNWSITQGQGVPEPGTLALLGLGLAGLAATRRRKQ